MTLQDWYQYRVSDLWCCRDLLVIVWYNSIYFILCRAARPWLCDKERGHKFASHELLIKLSFQNSQSIFHPPSIELGGQAVTVTPPTTRASLHRCIDQTLCLCFSNSYFISSFQHLICIEALHKKLNTPKGTFKTDEEKVKLSPVYPRATPALCISSWCNHIFCSLVCALYILDIFASNCGFLDTHFLFSIQFYIYL